MTQTADSTSPPARRTLPQWLREDWAYLLPMMVFLAFLLLGMQRRDWPWPFPATYAARVVVVGILLIWLWPAYTRIRWNGWWLGLLLGVIGIFQWVGLQLLLQKLFAGLPHPWNFFQPPPASEL